MGWAGPTEPTDNDEVLALLFLYASAKVWATVEEFFKLYYQVAALALTADLARDRGDGDVGARLKSASWATVSPISSTRPGTRCARTWA